MTGIKRAGLHSDGDTDLNGSGNPHIDDIVAARGSRRQVLGGMAALAGLFGLSGGGRSEAATVATAGQAQGATLGFDAIAKSLEDRVTVPEGYSVSVLYALGDPIAPGVPAPRNDGTDTDYARRSGDCHDGMHFFGLNAAGQRDDAASGRGLLCINHEYVIEDYLHADGALTVVDGARTVRSEVDKEIDCHGVSVIEVRGTPEGGWRYDPAAPLNRRITPNTPVAIHGPARGSGRMRTLYSPTGVAGRGTVNNCANGYAAWGSYLTCEENWAGYFNRAAGDDAVRPAAVVQALNRYGVRSGVFPGLNWGTLAVSDPAETRYRRWDASAGVDQPADGSGDFRNEPNQFGWVVEIDPYDPASTPRKRTALGRIAHEGAWPAEFVAGRPPVYYMGDDSRGEYFYKFVSATPWDPADADRTDRLAVGDKYLDDGTLYVARFDATGAGVWLPLVFGMGGLTADNALYPFEDQADVLIHARLAADAVGATRMDRPEWAAVNPANGEVYLTLTNGNATSRPIDGTDAANPRHYNDPRGPEETAQRGNPNGHILRLREAGDTAVAGAFQWDIYLFGAGSDLDADSINLSGLDASNDFASPDGLWFSRPSNPGGRNTPLLWIQTDDGSFSDQTNNQMLLAIPGRVGDGGPRTITNTDAGGATRRQATIVGKAPGLMLKRFLVGPRRCEITGIDSTPDGRTVFVNIQHPGEGGSALNPRSHWPASQTGPSTALPRSATIVITRNDGGVVGL
ncbi:MAG: PhoX family phosphatase [Brevundimonas sp.]|uniref:PhoX family protein n=1 Tax=Brevundimonas sp. TaxID=1871086 RepID=UPI0027373A03|nr:PhoX family phosphatase [Brevundimonas sp.]MDP3405313.1 PhoX family phosphatase [Brevundimonas sp.]